MATATPTTTYSCSYFGTTFYDSLSDCENATSANCTSEWQSFPNGGIQQCYEPVSGWESCQANPATWIYTPWTTDYCTRHLTGGGKQYEKYRSIISCSSTVCACTGENLVSVCASLGACGLASDPADCL